MRPKHEGKWPVQVFTVHMHGAAALTHEHAMAVPRCVVISLATSVQSHYGLGSARKAELAGGR